MARQNNSQPVADLTHAEAQAAFAEFERSIGSKAEVFVSLQRGGPHPLRASIYPAGILGKAQAHAKADTYRDLLADCVAVWGERSDLHEATLIREMALKIIGITADLGECTDAALRATFDASEVATYGERACAAATEMASNGPFSIVSLSGANQNEAA